MHHDGASEPSVQWRWSQSPSGSCASGSQRSARFGEIVATRGEEREHDEGEVAPPDEAVTARVLEVRVELGRGDHGAAVADR